MVEKRLFYLTSYVSYELLAVVLKLNKYEYKYLIYTIDTNNYLYKHGYI